MVMLQGSMKHGQLVRTIDRIAHEYVLAIDRCAGMLAGGRGG
jgi:hypothetical protein